MELKILELSNFSSSSQGIVRQDRVNLRSEKMSYNLRLILELANFSSSSQSVVRQDWVYLRSEKNFVQFEIEDFGFSSLSSMSQSVVRQNKVDFFKDLEKIL